LLPNIAYPHIKENGIALLSPYRRKWLDLALISITAAKADPSPEDLATAPLLDRWRLQVTFLGELVLEGAVTGHPTLDDTFITTSPLIALDPDSRWARTVSRWYRLKRNRHVAERGHAPHVPRPELPPVSHDEIARYLEAYSADLLHMDKQDRQARGKSEKDDRA